MRATTQGFAALTKTFQKFKGTPMEFQGENIFSLSYVLLFLNNDSQFSTGLWQTRLYLTLSFLELEKFYRFLKSLTLAWETRETYTH